MIPNSDPETIDHHETFVRQLTEHQNRIYGYVYSLLGDHNRAADVVQEANVVLWRKIDEFQPGKPFLPWAFTIARFQVLAHLRDKKRDRLLLDAELAEAISSEAERESENLEHVREALRPCLETLTPANRQMLVERYMHHVPVKDVAESVGRSVSATKVALMRVRRALAECIRNRLQSDTIVGEG